MDSKAINLAIELHRHPTLRHALRDRPVPADVGELLLLAAGSPLRLAECAKALDETPDEVLQAVRFFIQEVMLFPGADAYRILGVTPDADAAILKAHHRALQHWLHPDRLAGGPESAYASRVNRAWDQLRTSRRRREFDAAQAAPSADTLMIDAGMNAPVQVRRWQRVQAGERAGAQIAMTLAVFALCAGLLWLALRDRPVSAWLDPSEEGPLGSEPEPETASARHSLSANPIDAVTAVVPPPPKPASPVHSRPQPPVTRAVSPTQVPPPHESRPSAAVAPATSVASVPIQKAGAVVPTRVANPSSFTIRSSSPPVTLVGRSTEPAAAAGAIRTEAARERGATLLSFLTRRNDTPPPPIWHDAAALDAAIAIRKDLTRGGFFRGPRIELGQAHWTVKDQAALLTVPVESSDRNTGRRQLQARLTWKDEAWWVDAVAIEAQP